MLKIDYSFRQSSLYRQALTHKSASAHNNERLEFLGDSLVNFFIAEALFQQFSEATEGQLSRLRALLVNQASLAKIGRDLQLGAKLTLGAGELKSGGHQRDSILSDAVEALIAAIYIDSGSDMTVCRQAILPWFDAQLADLSLEEEYKDPKSLLQEWLQARKFARPEYTVLEETGPDNQRDFTVRCRAISLQKEAIAKGTSKKQAEQDAAAELLAKLLKRKIL